MGLSKKRAGNWQEEGEQIKIRVISFEMGLCIFPSNITDILFEKTCAINRSGGQYARCNSRPESKIVSFFRATD